MPGEAPSVRSWATAWASATWTRFKYDLLFERFMDPERNEMPDIDIDICQASRPAALDHVRQKYGHIAQIITFGTMKARAVIRDVCRVMDVPLGGCGQVWPSWCRTELKMTLDKALDRRAGPEGMAYDKDPKLSGR